MERGEGRNTYEAEEFIGLWLQIIVFILLVVRTHCYQLFSLLWPIESIIIVVIIVNDIMIMTKITMLPVMDDDDDENSKFSNILWSNMCI